MQKGKSLRSTLTFAAVWGPLLQSDLLVATARDFRSGLYGPTLPEMPAEVREIFGLKMADIELISSTLRGYYTSCTMNVLSLNALLLLMDNRGPMDTSLASAVPASSGRQELLVENMARLLDPSEMHPCVADLAWRLNAEGDSDDERVLKSLYRYLANWPVFLGAVWALVTPLANSGELKLAVTDCLRDADVFAQRLAATLNPSKCPLDEPTQDAVREALVEFARNAIPKSIPVTRALMRVVGTRVDS
jgi:hypothetical protein